MPATPLRFVPLEALTARTALNLPAPLRTGTTPPYYKSLLLRLLTGTLDLECSKTGQTLQQRNNYSSLVYTSNPAAYKKSITESIPCNLSKFSQHVRGTVGHNFTFYRDIFDEFASYFFCKENENYLPGFVHLYRIAEKIAYCLPLMWAAKARDYRGTFDTLKGYFNDPKRGELAVLRIFISDFIDLSERQIQATFNIQSIHPDWQSRYYRTLAHLLQNSSQLVSATPNSQIVVHFEAVLEIAIACRNRYFHALTGDSRSFSFEDVVDPDEFFAIINENLANWLSFLILKVLELELERA